MLSVVLRKRPKKFDRKLMVNQPSARTFFSVRNYILSQIIKKSTDILW